MQDVCADAIELIKDVTIWNQSNDSKDCEDKLLHLLERKQAIIKKAMDPLVWPMYYLSHSPLQQFLKFVVDIHKQMCSSDSMQLQAVRGFMRQVIGPIDLESVHSFPDRDCILKWVFETDKPLAAVGFQDFMMMLKYFEFALHSLFEGKRSDERFFEI